MGFTYTEQLIILGKLECCLGDLGEKVVNGLRNGTDVSCYETKLNFLCLLKDSISKYVPTGIIENGVEITSTYLTQEEIDQILLKVNQLCCGCSDETIDDTLLP